MSKISFIIPVYNTAKYLDKCMESVLNQTLSDIEIILVDDGSTDGVTPKMCDDYAAKDSRVNVIHKENGGLMSAWICGSKAATSDYLCYVDSDDWVDTEMAESLYALTDSSFATSEIIASNYIVEKNNERRKETQALKPGVYYREDLDKICTGLLGAEVRPVTMSRCMKLISKELLLNNLKYCNTDISMSEDVNITLPCLCDCQRLVITKDSYFYHYRLVGESIVHSYNPKLLSNLELTDKTFREILNDKKVDGADAQMDREFIIMLLVILKNELRCPEKDTAARVKKIFLRPDIRKKVTSTKVDVTSKANKLLYYCIKHPNPAVVAVTKAIITAYDRKTN
ncbi:Glycosyl transferase family 2 [Butyrivibrio sp. INlla18]|uniref:glycosyltransferase family 2 protein n=1 Tax=Butyrivibrio sp. INlla18 TaxID=1520806 RepID=UPI00088707EE|nr:glycosyltransferase family 2 protein [Butyrivibrio sp. INlla18]SDA55347.1 Glycosyl transferase family 2 [Butyrivibrio sp. INlla18]